MGKLVKGGEAAARPLPHQSLAFVLFGSWPLTLRSRAQDIDTAARIVLYDWQRGRIPYFTAPPTENENDEGTGRKKSVWRRLIVAELQSP